MLSWERHLHVNLNKMQLAKLAALAAILNVTLTANFVFVLKLKLCFSAQSGIVLNLFLNFEHK